MKVCLTQRQNCQTEEAWTLSIPRTVKVLLKSPTAWLEHTRQEKWMHTIAKNYRKTSIMWVRWLTENLTASGSYRVRTAEYFTRANGKQESSTASANKLTWTRIISTLVSSRMTWSMAVAERKKGESRMKETSNSTIGTATVNLWLVSRFMTGNGWKAA